MNRGKTLLSYLENLDIPVVAAVSGICFGGGLEVALACHIRFCSENALFAFPETNHGLLPGLGGTVRLGEKLPVMESLRIILGGDMINAEEALTLNIVDLIVKDEDLLSYTKKFLTKITQDRPMNIIQAVMRAIKNARQPDQAEAMKEETRMFVRLAKIEAERRRSE
jgi:enoyl-CoA hydratase/carnithine racemase